MVYQTEIAVQIMNYKQVSIKYSIPNSTSNSCQKCNGLGLKTRLIPVPDWNKYHMWPPLGGLRSLIFYKDTNGFDKVVKKVGKRVLIDETAFFMWIEDKNKTHDKTKTVNI